MLVSLAIQLWFNRINGWNNDRMEPTESMKEWKK